MRSAKGKTTPAGLLGVALVLGLTIGASGAVRLPNAPNTQRPAPNTGSKASLPLVWTDLDGRGYTPTFLRAHTATVFLFFSTECPLANVYLPRIQQLEADYYSRGVRLFLVDAHAADTLPRLREYVKGRKLEIPVVKDAEAVLAQRLGATRTPEAVVVDRDGRTIYQGRIDDHKDPNLVRKHYLTEALDAALAGRAVSTARTEGEGCFISRPAAVPVAGKPEVTYSRDIAPILQRHCVECHRPGEVAPFSLLTYDDARNWAQTLKDVTQRRIMPPWKPQVGFGDFHDARAMTPAELRFLAKWADSGAPAGNLKETPKPPVFAEGWTLGQPDVVIRPAQEYRLTRKADEGDEYRCFVLPAEFREDTYVTASQIRPDNRSIVHHIIVYIDATGKALELDAKDPEPGFKNPVAGFGSPVPGGVWLAGWAPGNSPRFAPPGVAVKIPKGARLVMEVHYHPNGQVERDRSTLGLSLARETVRQIPVQGITARPNLEIPAGDPAAEVKASVTLVGNRLVGVLPEDMTLHAISPHMHNVGREMRVWATLPGGERKELIWLKDWDFNWQESYHYRQPLRLPKGTRLEMTAVYDNSSANTRNPNRPPRKITWGEATTDEMCVAFLVLTSDSQQLEIQPPDPRTAVVVPPDVQANAATR